ncbi:MAG: hypothetical protein QXM22_00505 [Candidatus Bathyarchaeia archaeon]
MNRNINAQQVLTSYQAKTFMHIAFPLTCADDEAKNLKKDDAKILGYLRHITHGVGRRLFLLA